MDPIQLFAKNFVEIDYDRLPREVIEVTKKEVLDMFGVALAGIAVPGIREVTDLIVNWGGKDESTVIYYGKKIPAPMAAQANATMGHAMDFDDVHDLAVMHPAVPLVPAAMAVAESRGGVSGKEFIASVALGVDMICRLSLAAWPGYDPALPKTQNVAIHAERVKQGWHLTTLMGHLASAGVAGKLLGLDEERMRNAFGIAYLQCGGNLQGRDDGAQTKRLGPGFATRAGITSAFMAERGVTGARNCLEGNIGLYKMFFHGGYDRETLILNLGKHFEGVNVSIKPYPCCRGIHPSIDTIRGLVAQHDIPLNEVKEVRVFVDAGGHQMLSSPLEVKARPRTNVDAQFSIPWGVASALVGKRVGLSDFTDSAIKNREVLEVTQKMQVEVDNSLHKPGPEPTRVKIVTNDGKLFAKVVENPLGSLERPMSFEDCAAKFRDCAKGLDSDRVEKIIELVGQLERLDNIQELIRLLT